MTVRFFDAEVAQRRDQRLGNAAQAEAADGQHLPVLDHAVERRLGTGKDLVHVTILTSCDGRALKPRPAAISPMPGTPAAFQDLARHAAE